MQSSHGLNELVALKEDSFLIKFGHKQPIQ